MHVLFFTYDTIIPPDSGGKTRALNLIKYGKKDAKVTLFSFMREGYDLAGLEEIKKIGIEKIEVFPRLKKRSLKSLKSLFLGKDSIFYNLYFDEKVERALLDYVKEQKVDLVHFESFYTGFYLSSKLRELGVRQVYGSENIEHLLYSDSLKSLNPFLRKVAANQVEKIKEEEAQMARISDVTLSVTEKEKKYFDGYSKKTFVVPNGIDPDAFPEVSRDRKEKVNLLFVGNFTYFPNRDGLKFFMDNIWPRIDKKSVSLTVLGRGVEKLNFLPNETIEKIEYIDNIDKVYRSADIFVSPIRYGGGTNFKVLEAMASGLPVVALSEKIEGLNGKNNENILIAKDEQGFVESLQRLIEDSDLRKKIGKNARTFVRENYSWKDIGENLYKIWYDLVNEKS